MAVEPDHPQRLIARLEAIGQALASSEQALALLGLGSSGPERARLDSFSDLDFYVISRPGQKAALLQALDWMHAAGPVAFAFRNTADGYKLLYADGIFCELAVFEPHELAQAASAGATLVWAVSDFDHSLLQALPAAPAPPIRSNEWLLGEALTNLYVGLGRFRRGERLSAQRFIQHYAVDRLLELAAQLETEQPGWPDPFNLERRFEQRFPHMATQLGQFIQGYQHSLESAQAILAFLRQHFVIAPALETAITALYSDGGEA